MYGISRSTAPSSIMWVRNKEVGSWRKAPNMTVAREKALAGVVNGKIYVLGGCTADESVNWGEVFDPKTQTWEPLPDPGPEHRFSSIRRIQLNEGKLYVVSNEVRDFVYDPKEGKWDVEEESCMHCMIGNVCYYCDHHDIFWYDEKCDIFRVVRGLDTLDRNHFSGMIEIANYNGKVLVLWDEYVQPAGPNQYKDIWCAVIALERRNGIDEIWGNTEWASIVLTVPSSYVFLRGGEYAS